MNEFEYFKQISNIPRPSGHEEKIAEFIKNFASEHGLFCITDENNNVFIRKNADEGFEELSPVLLQAHTDMVCEKAEGKVHDFLRDPITLMIDGDTVRADRTTLGADDGSGVAVMLDILADKNFKTREIECLFTSSEETGMEGAFGFDYSVINSELMINLDSEEELNACIGCAGGLRCTANIPIDRIRPIGEAYRISISGLAGGHSGTEIDKDRKSALKLMGTVLDKLYTEYPFCIADITGLGRDNVIPFSCTATISFYDPSYAKSAKQTVSELSKEIVKTLCKDDKGFKLSFKKSEKAPESVLSLKSTSNVISAIMLAPQGVTDRVSDKNIVLASVNMGCFDVQNDFVKMGFLIRSGNEIYCNRTADIIKRLAHVLGGEAVTGGSYPGWDFHNGGKLQNAYKNACMSVFGKKPIFTVIHAGLECGIISHELKKYGKDPDIISIGPDVHDIHTPEERMGIASLFRMGELVRHIITNLS